jgi:hypothetical protein
MSVVDSQILMSILRFSRRGSGSAHSFVSARIGGAGSPKAALADAYLQARSRARALPQVVQRSNGGSCRPAWARSTGFFRVLEGGMITRVRWLVTLSASKADFQAGSGGWERVMRCRWRGDVRSG